MKLSEFIEKLELARRKYGDNLDVLVRIHDDDLGRDFDLQVALPEWWELKEEEKEKWEWWFDSEENESGEVPPLTAFKELGLMLVPPCAGVWAGDPLENDEIYDARGKKIKG